MPPLQQRQQPLARPIHRHNSLLTQVPAHLSATKVASLAPGPLLGLRHQPPALTLLSPPSLHHTQAQHLASTPQASPRVALPPTRPPTAMAATATLQGPPIPVLSHQRGDPSTDQDMEFHSHTPESTTAPVSQFFFSILPFFTVSPLFSSLPPWALSPLTQSPCPLLVFLPFLPPPSCLPWSQIQVSLYLSLLHYFSLSLNISLLISVFLSFLFPFSVTLLPPHSPTLVSGCYVVFKCLNTCICPFIHSLSPPTPPSSSSMSSVCVAIGQSERPYKHTSALPLETNAWQKSVFVTRHQCPVTVCFTQSLHWEAAHNGKLASQFHLHRAHTKQLKWESEWLAHSMALILG